MAKPLSRKSELFQKVLGTRISEAELPEGPLLVIAGELLQEEADYLQAIALLRASTVDEEEE